MVEACAVVCCLLCVSFLLHRESFPNPMWLAFEDTIQIILKLATGYHVLRAAVMSGRLARRKYVFSWAFPLDILSSKDILGMPHLGKRLNRVGGVEVRLERRFVRTHERIC